MDSFHGCVIGLNYTEQLDNVILQIFAWTDLITYRTQTAALVPRLEIPFVRDRYFKKIGKKSCPRPGKIIDSLRACRFAIPWSHRLGRWGTWGCDVRVGGDHGGGDSVVVVMATVVMLTVFIVVNA